MNTWYIRIWPEAAYLRNNNIEDDRLKPLDDILTRFDATMTLHDRTGTGDDCHYKVDFEGDKATSDAFLNAMIFGAQEVSMTMDKPIDLDNVSDDPEVVALQDTKKNLWAMGVQVEEQQVVPKLTKLIEEIEKPNDPDPTDQIEP